MYTILIVEDEKIEREHLVHMINKNMDEIGSIWSAKNGYEALDIFRANKVDLIITDIEMPGMNGLDLIREIKAIDSSAIFIILTSYNCFEYAQRAIKLGVEDFILKPANTEVVMGNIRHVLVSIQQRKTRHYQTSELVSKMNQMKPILESDCLQTILTNSDGKEIEKSLLLLDYQALEGICIVLKAMEQKKECVFSFVNSVEDLGYKCIKDYYYDSFVIFILYASPFAVADIRVIEQIINQYFTKDDNVLIGNVCRYPSNFYKSYQFALQNHKDNAVLSIEQDTKVRFTSTTFESLAQDLLKAHRKLDKKEINRLLDRLYFDIISYDTTLIQEYLSLFYRDFYQLLVLDYPDLQAELANSEKLCAAREVNLNELQSRLKIDIWSFFKPIDEYQAQSTNILVKKAYEYIAKNYQNPINLNDLAEYLHVTPFYISKLLNQHSKMNFTDLVSHYRIEESKMLLQKNMRVKEIAYSLGFQSQSYFAKVFKKFTDMTPKEYKNSIS